MDTVVLGARLVVAALFTVAAVTKLRDPAGTARAFVDLGGGRRYAAIAARLLPAVELVIAVALLVQPLAVAAAVAALAVLLVFTGAIVDALRHSRAPDCGCFGNLSSRPVDRWTVARNVGLLLVALLIAVRGPGSSIAPLAGVLVLVAAAIFGAIAGSPSLPVSSVTRGGAGAGPGVSGIPVGSPAPEFSLRDACGDEGSLTSLRSAGLPVVLLFLSSGCGACRELHPHLGRWQTTLGERLSIAVIMAGEADAARMLCGEHGVRNVLIDGPGDPLWQVYGMPGTPSGLAVAPDGAVASVAVRGPDALEELVRHTLGYAGQADGTWKQPVPMV
jgi:thiol-disulfide isomerase/thioredoxin